MNHHEELVDYYNESGEVIGTCTRHEADENNYIYPNVIVFLFTHDSRVWIQKRSLTKRHFPGIWDTSACGALAHGEDPLIAAARELEEEMSVQSELTFVEKFLNTFPSEDGTKTYSRISYIFVGVSKDTPKGNHEVEAVAAFDIDQLLVEAAAKPGDFVPSFKLELDKALVGYRSNT
jgi:isopentenyldiphosphate isomerase